MSNLESFGIKPMEHTRTLNRGIECPFCKSYNQIYRRTCWNCGKNIEVKEK